jgi:hypothetical protein
MQNLEEIARDIRNAQLIRFGASGKTLDEFLNDPGEFQLAQSLHDLTHIIRQEKQKTSR